MKTKVIIMNSFKGFHVARDNFYNFFDAICNSAVNSGNDLQIASFQATEPPQVKDQMNRYMLKWNYPWNGEVVRDMQSGLTKTGYQTAVPAKRMACFLSHYRLWMECAEAGEPYLILEHDARFQNKIDPDFLASRDEWIISVNQPQPGCTPKALAYEKAIVNFGGQKGQRVVPVPAIATFDVPAGLPGNSAYYIKPQGAKKMIELAREYGAWPNDALMCRQLVGADKMGCLYPFVTRIADTGSSTST